MVSYSEIFTRRVQNTWVLILIVMDNGLLPGEIVTLDPNKGS